MAIQPILSLQSAKAYVVAWHAERGARADVIGCAIIAISGCTLCRLNVDLTDADGNRDAVQWDVWAEDGALYGEF